MQHRNLSNLRKIPFLTRTQKLPLSVWTRVNSAWPITPKYLVMAGVYTHLCTGDCQAFILNSNTNNKTYLLFLLSRCLSPESERDLFLSECLLLLLEWCLLLSLLGDLCEDLCGDLCGLLWDLWCLLNQRESKNASFIYQGLLHIINKKSTTKDAIAFL